MTAMRISDTQLQLRQYLTTAINPIMPNQERTYWLQPLQTAMEKASLQQIMKAQADTQMAITQIHSAVRLRLLHLYLA